MAVGAMDLPPEGMLLGGVALAGDPARGIETTEGLSLLFTTEGITVKGDQPATERHFAWSGLDAASCHGEVQRGGGRTATPLELTSAGQTIQFLLPSETVSPGQAAYLDQALPAWLERYSGTDGPPAAAASPGSATPTVPRLRPPRRRPPKPRPRRPRLRQRPPTPPAPTPPAPTAPPAPRPVGSVGSRRLGSRVATAAPVRPLPGGRRRHWDSADHCREAHIDPATGTLRRGDPLSSARQPGRFRR